MDLLSPGRESEGGVAASAAAYLAHRQDVLRRLARVDAVLAQWADYDAHFRQTAPVRPFPAPPTLPRMGLRCVRALLVHELSVIDGSPSGQA